MKVKKQVIRFVIAGIIVNATDFSIYYSLFHFLTPSISKGISFTCAGIVGYLLSKYWTFKHKQTSYAEIGRYVIVSFISLGINVFTNQSILNAWPGSVFLALIMATLLTGLFTFVGFKRWVFIG